MLPAIAAGNCAIVKPRWQSQVNFIDNFIIMDLLSEIAPATATAIAQLLPKYIDQVGFCPTKEQNKVDGRIFMWILDFQACVKVVEGGVPETTALLKVIF